MNPLFKHPGQTIASAALRLHRWLLPPELEVGWLPYLWLVYLGFLFISWFLGQASVLNVAATLAAIVIFLPLYFLGFRYSGAASIRIIIAIAAIGVALLPINFGGGAFFIYAAAFVGYATPRSRNAFGLLLTLTLVSVVEPLLLGLPLGTWFSFSAFTAIVGLANIWVADRARRNAELRLSQDEVRRLAAVAERERIARDLHDLLGHTLTLITVKAELAAKLAERNMGQAATEMRDLECIARDALAQVREAVGGYRSGNLAGELANARAALRAASVSVEAELADVELTPAQDAILAMVVREAATNVVRHADAQHCRIALRRQTSTGVLVIEDDGRGGPVRDGHGLRGMRERLQAIDGTLAIASGWHGTQLEITIPLDSSESPATSCERVA
jgi:two-component system sensor histidine kinase DesK